MISFKCRCAVRPSNRSFPRLLLLSFLAAGLLSTTAQAELRKVAFVGEEAPGAPDDAKYLQFSFPTINDKGEVLFLAVLEQGSGGVTAANDLGYWSEITGSLDVVIREGDDAPDTAAGVKFGPNFDASGFITDEHVIFGNQLPIGVAGVTATDNYGLWRGDGTTLDLAIREGNQPNATGAGVKYSGFFAHAYTISKSGRMTVLGSLLTGSGGVTSSNDRGIWTDRFGPETYIAREGSSPPSMPLAVNDRLTAPVMNDLGHIAYVADMIEGLGGVTVNDDEAMWSDRGGAFGIIYREGQTAPGVPGSEFEHLFAPQISPTGRLAFAGEMREGLGGVTAANKQGLWAEDGVGLQLLARVGDAVPDMPGFVYTEINSSWITLHMNESGGTAYVATVDGPGTLEDGSGVWSTAMGSLENVMHHGQAAPGTGAGVTFNSIQNILSLRLNSLGQTAFGASLQGAGITGANDFGIWAQDTDGELQLIAREGQMVEIAPGDSRTIGLLQYGDFNDRGELTFTASFNEGGQGVFVSTLVASLGLAGDYNENDIVDSADYTIWRDAMTAGLSDLPNRDPMKSGLVDNDDFLFWRARYGDVLGSGAGGGSVAIPEPSAALLMSLGASLAVYWRKRRR